MSSRNGARVVGPFPLRAELGRRAVLILGLNDPERFTKHDVLIFLYAVGLVRTAFCALGGGVVPWSNMTTRAHTRARRTRRTTSLTPSCARSSCTTAAASRSASSATYGARVLERAPCSALQHSKLVQQTPQRAWLWGLSWQQREGGHGGRSQVVTTDLCTAILAGTPCCRTLPTKRRS